MPPPLPVPRRCRLRCAAPLTAAPTRPRPSLPRAQLANTVVQQIWQIQDMVPESSGQTWGSMRPRDDLLSVGREVGAAEPLPVRSAQHLPTQRANPSPVLPPADAGVRPSQRHANGCPGAVQRAADGAPGCWKERLSSIAASGGRAAGTPGWSMCLTVWRCARCAALPPQITSMAGCDLLEPPADAAAPAPAPAADAPAPADARRMLKA